MGIFKLGPASKFFRNAGTIVKPFQPQVTRDQLNVMSYNMGFDVGPVQNTLGETKSESEYLHSLDEIVRIVEESETDILLLQEVDLNSRRSLNMNQLSYLQERLKWPHAACSTTWKCFVPFDKIGKVDECAAILSRYPICKHQARIYKFNPLHTNRLLNLMLYLFFVWRSPVQYVQIEFQDRKLNIFNLHLDVFSRRNRELQIENLIQWIKESGLDEHLLFGGDLNYHAELGRERREEFRDFHPDNEKLPPFFQDVWKALPGLQEAFIRESTPQEQIHQNVTFPELGKRHDFVFFSSDFEHVSSEVIQTISSSDHLPVLVKLTLQN